MWVSRTILVPASLQAAAQNLGACLTPAAVNMFTTPLSATGVAPATWYVSSGMIEDIFIQLLSNSTLLYSEAQQQGAATLTATQAAADALVAQAVVVDTAVEVPFDTFARLGLTIINPVI